MKKIILVFIALIAFIALYFASFYNQVISLNQKADQQWAQVNTQYQRRFDLIPNLVSSVQGIMKQEQKIFGDLAAARTQYSGAKTVDDQATAATNLESTLGRLLVIMENYPTLKSNENVTRLMDELAGTENRIAVERGRFNDQITAYNMAIIRFPANLIASIFSFKPRPFFQITTGADAVPEVKLNP